MSFLYSGIFLNSEWMRPYTRNKTLPVRHFLNVLIIISGISILHIIARRDYLLFHTLVELFSIVVAFALFSVTWNSRKMLDNTYLIIVGIVAFFIGLLDLLHTITYKGMGIIPGTIYYANQFWIATRFLESITLLIGFLFLSKKIRISCELLFMVYAVITGLIILSILQWKIFPVCYLDGSGQTHFKIYSEYVIILILFLAFYFLVKNHHYFHRSVYFLLMFSIISTIISEFCFTLYASNYGLFNQLGHYFKLVSFYLIYKANIETGFIKPTEIIYRNLKLSQEKIDHFNKQLQDQIATRDKLFSIIAHDLRSPFTAILGYAELLYKEGDSYDKEQVKRFSETIYTIGNNTAELLENLLHWSRLKSGTVKAYISEINLHEIIREVYRLYREMALKKEVDLKLELNEGVRTIHADSEMIRTVVRNLVANALKFTDSGGVITINTSSLDGQVLVTVSDTGIGIKPEDISRLFGNADNWTTAGTANEKGSGLGLQLCKEFVEKNNGKIWVESEPGKGSRFMFTLPKTSSSG